jgi:hypothetical protein
MWAADELARLETVYGWDRSSDEREPATDLILARDLRP